MSNLLWALLLGLALGGPPLQSLAANFLDSGGATPNAGNRFDPDGGASPDAGSIFDPDGDVTPDAGSRFDPNG